MIQRKPPVTFYLFLFGTLLLPLAVCGADPRPWKINDLYDVDNFGAVAVLTRGRAAAPALNNQCRVAAGEVRWLQEGDLVGVGSPQGDTSGRQSMGEPSREEGVLFSNQ